MKPLKFPIIRQEQIQPVLKNVAELIGKGLAAGKVIITLGRESRSVAQNNLMWPLLTDFSKQVDHFGKKYTDYQWKDLLTAGFEGCVEYAPNLDGSGLIAFGVRTSAYSKKKFAHFIEFIYSEGIDRGVKFSAASIEVYQDELRRAA